MFIFSIHIENNLNCISRDNLNKENKKNLKIHNQSNNNFSNEVLKKVQFNIADLQNKYNFENVLEIWNDIFSLEDNDKNDNRYLEFSYLMYTIKIIIFLFFFLI